MTRLRPMMEALLVVFALLLAHSVGAETWRFAVIGDTAYSTYEAREVGQLVLYFEIRRNGKPVDPAPWFRAREP